MLDFIDDPPFVRDLFDFVLEMALRFGKAQADAGADLIGVGDAAASLVGPRIYEEFVLPYEKRLVDGLHAMGVKVRLHICGNTRRILRHRHARLRHGGHRLDGSPGAGPAGTGAEAGVGRQRRSRGRAPQRHSGEGERGDRPLSPSACANYIVGAGCEVCRDTPLENVLAMRDYTRTSVESRVES